MSTVHSGLSRSERQEALDGVLASSVLRRSEQLRRILVYICTEEIEGRGSELTESSIAVHALGRATEYSPDTDSTVRTRIYDLRKRLDEHYRKDGLNASCRVELPKGTYRPSFIRVPDPDSSDKGADGPQPVVTRKKDSRAVWVLFGVLTGSLVTLALVAMAGAIGEMPFLISPGEKAVRAAWGPLLKQGGTVTVVLATPMQLWVREFGDDPAPRLATSFLVSLPPDAHLMDWYRRLTVRTPKSLWGQPNSHSPLWGDAAAAVAACRFLAKRGVDVELLPESSVRPAALKERNAVLIGRGDYSSVVEVVLPEGGYFVRYVPEKKEVGIVDSRNGTGFYRERDGVINYGLVTVRTPHPGQSQANRYIIVSGINSDGTQAGMEFLGSPDKMADLKERLVAGGRKDWPSSFQIVVRTISSDSYTMQAQYAAHRVF
ncbi:MAG TPA: hypothetical protein VN442_17335 [Bryobacteraceae bacterium]|nr:hypothetical protein [Bryobacteraceae bacterium]